MKMIKLSFVILAENVSILVLPKKMRNRLNMIRKIKYEIWFLAF